MEKKKIWWTIGLLFLLYCSSSGNYLNSGDQYLYDNSSWLALIDLLICSFALMIVPFVWRLINKRRFDAVKGKKICRWNSIILFIISIIMQVAMEISIIGGLGALMYYFINKWLFVDETQMPETENYEYTENTTKFKCNNCGHLVSEDSKYCTNCLLTFDEEEADEEDDADESEEEETETLDIIYDRGVSHIKLGQYEEGTKYLKQYLKEVEQMKKTTEEDWYTFNNCVELVLFTKENEAEAKNIVDINYESSNAYLYLAMADFENKDYEEAIKKLNKALKWNPNNINVLFERAETYKNKGDLKKYYNLTLDLYDKIYTINDLAHYYRNLGYYFIETENWDLAKALYLYSVRFENNDVALTELKYIISKSKDNSLPAKDDLQEILKEERIPTFIAKETIKIVNELYNQIVKEDKENSNVGRLLKELTSSYKEY